jgi:hypothetical protein
MLKFISGLLSIAAWWSDSKVIENTCNKQILDKNHDANTEIYENYAWSDTV